MRQKRHEGARGRFFVSLNFFITIILKFSSVQFERELAKIGLFPF